jgi:hypothetical protein
MTVLQKKFIESRLVLVALIVTVIIFQDTSWYARGAFVPLVLYGFFNFETLKEIELTGPTPAETLATRAFARYWMVMCVLVEAGISYYSLFSGRDLGKNLNGFGSLMFAFLLPILPVAFISQYEMFRRLKSAA